jgi:hypothetical protein
MVYYEKLEDLYFPPELLDEQQSMGFGRNLKSVQSSLRSWQLDEAFLDAWEYEANRITGNLNQEQLNRLGNTNIINGRNSAETVDYSSIIANNIQARKWYYSGSIFYHEDDLNTTMGTISTNYPNYMTVLANRVYSPLRQAKINVLKWGWLSINSHTVGSNGRYNGSTRTKSVTYKLTLEDRRGNKDFQIQATHEWNPATFTSRSFERGS